VTDRDESVADRLARLLGWSGLWLLLTVPAFGGGRTDLDRDWQFRADPELAGDAAGWNSSIPPDTQSIDVPHTWNAGRLHDYLGVAWYFHRFDLPPLAPGAHVELHFGATFYSAHVWLNGVELGGHEGGFTAYAFDVTSKLRAQNMIAVRIDNRPGIATIPGFAERGSPGAPQPEVRYDWWTFGGIVRDVWLTTSGTAWVGRQTIRTSPLADGAMIHDRIILERALAPGVPVTRSAPTTIRRAPTTAPSAPIAMRVTAFDPDGRVAASETRMISLAAGATDIAVSLKLKQPKLWSIDHPSLYRMVVELTGRNNELLDEHSDAFGVRTVEIRERHLLVNGERVRLTGLARHEDSPWEGLAETKGTIWHDYDDMRALHTTLTRPVHYPQHPLVLDYADRHGILLIPEIPVWQFSEEQLSDPRVLALAQRQMREMIEEAGNHPSIFAWSVANESAMSTPGGIAYFRAMRDMIRKLDPDRFVSFTDDKLPKLERAEQSAANDADFVMMNQYYGSWHGPAEALVPALDQIDHLFPGKMVVISEMGFAGIFAKGPLEADRMRVTTMRDQMPLLAARDWIAGAILWCYQDYKSPRNLWPGMSEGYVEHGVVDEARQRKPSYQVWKKLTEPATITAHWVSTPNQPPTGFALLVAPNSERSLPYYPLHDYRLIWSIVDESGKSLGGGERRFALLIDAVPVTGALQAGEGHTLRLNVELQSPTGLAVADEVLEWPHSVATQ
jgi:beta-glucuronidase